MANKAGEGEDASLAEALLWEHLLQAFLVFLVLFWIYGGYTWLTIRDPRVTYCYIAAGLQFGGLILIGLIFVESNRSREGI